MKKEVIETGKTVEEAIATACEKLGVDRDTSDCQWEIIDLPKKGFLGLKNIPAKVRVYIDVPDDAPAQEKPKAAPAAPRPAATPPRESKPPVQDKTPEVRERAPMVQSEIPGQPIDLVGHTLTKAETARDYLQNVLREMKLDPALEIVAEENGICINITGEGLGAIIGRRGETLDSLQYLSGLVANRLEGDYLRITVDCGDYRIKRKATLEALARKLSTQVLRTNTSKTLEPMNPFERRIIHATVSTIEGVSSTSIGEEPNRRVVITSPTARPPRSGRGGPRTGPGGRGGDRPRRPGGYNNRDRDSRGGGYNRDRGGSSYNRGGSGGYNRDDRRGPRREQRPSQVVHPTSPPINPPKEAEDKPLYGKIDLE